MISDHDLDRAIGLWLNEPQEMPDDLSEVVARLPGISQKRGLLPPLPKWSFKTMFSATKFAAAAAIVALFGGFLLAAQPFDRRDRDAPGVAIESASPANSPASPELRERCDGAEPLSERNECMLTLVNPPVEVSGSIHAFACTGGAGGAILGVDHEACSHQAEAVWSDPRLDGTLTIEEDSDRYLSEDGRGRQSGPVLWSLAIRIENEEGAWQMQPYRAFGAPGEEFSATWILEGEGAYEGFVALLRVDSPLLGYVYTPTGYIVARDDVPVISGDHDGEQ